MNILATFCIPILLVSSALSYPLLKSPRPLVIWHGLGDSSFSPGLLELKDDIASIHPGIFVHFVTLGSNEKEDRKRTWFGNINEDLESVCEELDGIEELKEGFDAIGFSQGSQFLRAYVERCNRPKVYNLITFGGQHMGVSDLPGCKSTDYFCKLASSLAKGNVYSPYAQTNLIQAQYFRDPRRMGTYLSENHFLPYINNELNHANASVYKDNFSSLQNLILLSFTLEATVVPAISATFGSLALSNATDGELVEVPMRAQPLYLEDLIGLRKLDEQGKVWEEWCEGQHMQLGGADGCFNRVVKQWVGWDASKGSSELVQSQAEKEFQIPLVVQRSLHLGGDW